ncbi:MAG: hypothetical protein K2X48_06630 [Chitinophagaceae bacterium]|nr:hypothetical protein [Chitinophagaceae bacterium]
MRNSTALSTGIGYQFFKNGNLNLRLVHVLPKSGTVVDLSDRNVPFSDSLRISNTVSLTSISTNGAFNGQIRSIPWLWLNLELGAAVLLFSNTDQGFNITQNRPQNFSPRQSVSFGGYVNYYFMFQINNRVKVTLGLDAFGDGNSDLRGRTRIYAGLRYDFVRND